MRHQKSKMKLSLLRFWPSFLLKLVALQAGAGVALLGALFVIKVSLISDVQNILPQIQARLHHEGLLHVISDTTFEIQAARYGHALTGEHKFAEAFESATAGLRVQLAELESLTSRSSGSSGTGTQVGLLTKNLAEYEAHLRASIAERRAQPTALQLHQDSTLRGEAISRAVLRDLETMEHSEERQIDTEIGRLLYATRILQRNEILLSGIGLAMILSAISIAFAQVRQRTAAQGALQDANASLEFKVTERTAALNESEQRYKRLVELSADSILLCAADRSILYANPTALRLIDPSYPSPLIGRRVDSIFGAQHQSWLPQWLDEVWKNAQSHVFREASALSVEGMALPVEVGAVSYVGAEGMCVQLVIHDLTEIRARDAALRDQLTFIDQVVEAIPAPVSVRDDRGRYLRVNRAYELLYRCERGAIRNRSVFDALPYPLASLMVCKDAAVMQRSQPLVYEFEFKASATEATQLLATSCALRRSDGTFIGVITVDTDVGALRKKETELALANAELEALSQQLIHAQEAERRRIARELHDQIGQVLTALKISLQLLEHRQASDPKAVRTCIELVDEALNQARNLTASLHPHVLEDLGLVAAVNWVIDRLVRPAMQQVTLDAEVHPLRSSAARELVAFRVIQEALTNVIRHADADRVKVDLRTRSKYLHLSIADNGQGFELASTWFDIRQSTSLGIASMRERVTEVGGSFTVESSEGGGTTVHAVLPW